MNDLEKGIKKHISPTEKELFDITRKFKKKAIKKGRFLVRAGQVSNEFMFIEQGCLRVFWEKENGKEITSWFAFENEFFCELSTYIPQKPSKYGVQAIEDTTVYYINRDEVNQLFKEVPIFETFFRKFWEEIITFLVNGMVSFQSETAEERYKKMMKRPEIMQRIPLKYLSSLLGITPTSLSRLRKQI